MTKYRHAPMITKVAYMHIDNGYYNQDYRLRTWQIFVYNSSYSIICDLLVIRTRWFSSENEIK